MIILGFETSCDETGVAVVCTERGLLAHALHTQIALHQEYGGVVPELASRDHVRHIVPLSNQVLHESGLSVADVDTVAYTAGPGLAGALLVGASFAQAFAWARGLPVIAVHHLEGHLLSPLLSPALTESTPTFPFVALLVSGGHTQLMRVDAVGRYTLLGETLDDAAGEAFDKSAKLLGLGYPGGPALAAAAEKGNPDRFALPRPLLHSGKLDFSFSGLKTAVLTCIKAHVSAGGNAAPTDAKLLMSNHVGSTHAELASMGKNAAPTHAELASMGKNAVPTHSELASMGKNAAPTHAKLASIGKNAALLDVKLDPSFVADLAAATQLAIVDVLVAKARRALQQTGLKCLVVAGGVGANQLLRQRLTHMAVDQKAKVYFPPPALCTDNGAMIAFAAGLRIKAGLVKAERVKAGDGERGFTVYPRWDLHQYGLQFPESNA